MPGPIDWNRAERVALSVAARQPLGGRTDLQSTDFTEIARLAEDRVETTTGLRSLRGPAEVRIVDRPDWIRANITSMRSLIDPVLTRWLDTSTSGLGARGRGFTGAMSAVSAQVAGFELGMMLGWMSARVLGQYDMLVGDAVNGDTSGHSAVGDGDSVYLVGPNITALEDRFGFEPDQFRLWVTLHELTHRAQFTGVPWMREHFVGLVQHTLDLADPDPARILAALRDAVQNRGAANQRFRDGGIVAMVATPDQQAVLHRVAGLMSLLEGHGDVVMDRAGADLIPSAERFSRVLHERRRRGNPMGRFVQRLIGLEAKMNQYAAGEQFIAAIEAVGGERAVDRCWEHPDHLPTLDEIRDPQQWLARMEPAVA